MGRKFLSSLATILVAITLSATVAHAQFPPPEPCSLECATGVDTLVRCQNGLAYVPVPGSKCSQALVAQASTGFRDTLELTQTVLRIPLPAGFTTGNFSVTWMQKATAFTLGDTCTSSYVIPNTAPKPATFNLTDCGKVEIVQADTTCGLSLKFTQPGWEACCSYLEWGQADVYNVLNPSQPIWSRMFFKNNPTLYMNDSLPAGDYMIIFRLQDDHSVERRCTTYITIPPSGELVKECRKPELFLTGCFWSLNVFQALPPGNCATVAYSGFSINGPGVSYSRASFSGTATYPTTDFDPKLQHGLDYVVTYTNTTYEGWSYECVDTIHVPNSSLQVDCETATVTLFQSGDCGDIGADFFAPDATTCTTIEWWMLTVFRDGVPNYVWQTKSAPGTNIGDFTWTGPIPSGWYTAVYYVVDRGYNASLSQSAGIECTFRFYVPAGTTNAPPSIDCVPIIGGTVSCGGTIHVAIPPALLTANPCGQVPDWTTTVVNTTTGQTLYTGPTNGVPSGMTLGTGSYTVYYSATNGAGNDACAWSFTITSTTTPPVVTCPIISPGTTNCEIPTLKIIPAATASTGNCNNQQISWTTTITTNGNVIFNGATNGVPAGMQFSAGTYTITYIATNTTGSGTCSTSFTITNANTPSLGLDCSAEPTYVEVGNCKFNVVVAQALQTPFCGSVEWGKVTVNGTTWMFNGLPSVTFFGLNAGTTYTAEFTYVMVGSSTEYKCWKNFTTPPATPYLQLFCANVITTFAAGPNCTQTVTATLPIVAEYCGAKVQPGSGKARLHTGQLVNITNNAVSFPGLQPGTLYTLEFSYQMIGDTTPFNCTRNFVTPVATATISMNCDKVVLTSALNSNCTWIVWATEPDPLVSCGGTITLRKATLNGTNKPIVNGLVTLDQLAGSTQYTLVYTYQISGSTLTYNCTKKFTTDPLPAPQISCSEPTVYSVDSCGSGLSIPLPLLTGCVPSIIGVEVDVYDLSGDLVRHGSFASLAAGTLFQTGTLPAGTYTVTTTVLYSGGDVSCTSAPISVTGGVPRVEVDCSDVVRNFKCDGSFDLYAATVKGYCGAQLVPEWILNSFVDSTGKQVWMYKFMPNQPQVLHVTPDSLPAGTYTLNVLYYTVNGFSDSCSITVVIPEADPCCGDTIAPFLECKALPDSVDICDPVYNITGDSLELVLNPDLYDFWDSCTSKKNLIWMATVFQPGVGFIAFATNQSLRVMLARGTYVITIVVRDPQYNWSVACQQMITVYCSDDVPKPEPVPTLALRMWPNPATSQVTIDLGQGVYEHVFIYSLDGRLIKDLYVINQGTLDLSMIPDGLYIVAVPGRSSQKLVVQK